MIEWRNIQIKDFCCLNPKTSISKGSIVKKIGMEKLTPFCRKIGGFTEESYSSGAKFQKGDTLLARITPCLENGKTAFVDILEEGEIAFGSTEFIVLRKKDGVSDALFLYYLAISPDFRERAISLMNGTSGRQRIEATPLGEEFFLFPPLEIQRKIAGILGALDDKIEVLREQNKTLEQMAQAVFQSWFVDFDIVRAKAAGTPTEDICKKYHITPDLCALFPSAFTPDYLPQGWKLGKIEDLCSDIQSGGTPKRNIKEYWYPPTIPWLSSGEVNFPIIIHTKEKISEEGLRNSSAKIWKKYTTVVAMYGATAGESTLLGIDVSANQACCALIPYKHTIYYVYLLAKANQNTYALAANGAAQQNLNKTKVSELKVIIPDVNILIRFQNLVSAFFEKIIENSKQIRTLEQTRDTLLPQLLGGKLDVENVSLPSVNDEV
ncbi:MAG: restriction endonuclease subunit S [Alphaproteobacteria bacterium]|nr:restriction endonuclease subunit S [Alphaproteobacteria bacterium]